MLIDKIGIPEDLTRFLLEEEWFYVPNNQSIRTAVKAWCAGKRPKKNGHICSWNTSRITDMSSLFECQGNFDDDIGAWDVSNVTTMCCMFYGATSFNSPLERWVVSNVINMRSMFNCALNFNQPLATWDVSKLMDKWFMFSNADSFNHSLEQWDVSNVEKNGVSVLGRHRFSS